MKRLIAYSLIAAIIFSLTVGNTPALSQSKAPGLPTAKPEEVGMSSERLARIRTGMQRYVDKDLVPGVVTMVARRGKVVYLDYGQQAESAEKRISARSHADGRLPD